MIIDGIITENLDNLPITLKGIYFTNSAYKLGKGETIVSIEKKENKDNKDNTDNRDNSYFDFVTPYEYKKCLSDTNINVYSFSLFSNNTLIYVKVPFNCKIYNKQMKEIENFDGYVLVEYKIHF